MSENTTLFISKKSFYKLNKFQSQVVDRNEGKPVKRDIILDLLISGYSFNEDNEKKFIKSLESKQESSINA